MTLHGDSLLDVEGVDLEDRSANHRSFNGRKPDSMLFISRVVAMCARRFLGHQKGMDV